MNASEHVFRTNNKVLFVERERERERDIFVVLRSARGYFSYGDVAIVGEGLRSEAYVRH